MTDREFEIDRIVLCEYASQDMNGRQVHVGVYDPQTFFPGEPLGLQPLFISISVKPLAKDFELFAEVVGPDKIGLVRGSFQPSFKGEIPDNYRLNITFNMPPLPFPGFGEYRIIIRNKSERVVASQAYWFKPSEIERNIPFVMNGSVEINRAFLEAHAEPALDIQEETQS